MWHDYKKPIARPLNLNCYRLTRTIYFFGNVSRKFFVRGISQHLEIIEIDVHFSNEPSLIVLFASLDFSLGVSICEIIEKSKNRGLARPVFETVISNLSQAYRTLLLGHPIYNALLGHPVRYSN